MILAVRAPNWVGDLVMATPVLHAALCDPRVEALHVLLRGHLAPLLAGGPLEPHLRPVAGGGEERAAYAELRPDAVLLLSNSFGAARRARSVPVRAGAALSGRGVLLTHRLRPARRDGRRVPQPTAHSLADVAGLLGIEVPELEPRLDLAAAERAALAETAAECGFDASAGYVACAPGAAFGAAKLWPPERFAAALDALSLERGWPGVLFGAPSESAILEAVAARCAEPVCVVPAGRRSLGLSKALVAGARLLVVGDSGPRWLAAAFQVPCVSVMGPNFPELTASSLGRARIVRREGLACAPCLERTCPLGHHRCMVEIDVGQVLGAVAELLDGASANGAPASGAPASGAPAVGR